MEPTWHTVAFQDIRDVVLPAAVCCNCATTAGVEVRPTWLRHEAAFSGTQYALKLHVPCCADCAPTLRAGVGLAMSGFGFAAFVTIVAALVGGLFVLEGGIRPTVGFTVAGAAALAVIGAIRAWVRRPLRGRRVTNFRPVRLIGVEPVVHTHYVSFANPVYAALVSQHFNQLSPTSATLGTCLPAARMVSRSP
ncbi:MAG: hypothetical protein R3B06_03510 [Kofleriaceae bacterium]